MPPVWIWGLNSAFFCVRVKFCAYGHHMAKTSLVLAGFLLSYLELFFIDTNIWLSKKIGWLKGIPLPQRLSISQIIYIKSNYGSASKLNLYCVQSSGLFYNPATLTGSRLVTWISSSITRLLEAYQRLWFSEYACSYTCYSLKVLCLSIGVRSWILVNSDISVYNSIQYHY